MAKRVAPRARRTKPVVTLWRRHDEQSIQAVQRLCESFECDIALLSKSPPSDKALTAAAGYFLGYPQFAELIGFSTGQERSVARHTLNRVHILAIERLMEAALSAELESGPIWRAGRICQELYSTCPTWLGTGEYATWPECIRDAGTSIDSQTKADIRAGDMAFAVLSVKMGIKKPVPSNRVIFSADIRSPQDWAGILGYSKNRNGAREFTSLFKEQGDAFAKKINTKKYAVNVERLPPTHPESPRYRGNLSCASDIKSR